MRGRRHRYRHRHRGFCYHLIAIRLANQKLLLLPCAAWQSGKWRAISQGAGFALH
jgi:hypothetical protein